MGGWFDTEIESEKWGFYNLEIKADAASRLDESALICVFHVRFFASTEPNAFSELKLCGSKCLQSEG